MIAKLEDIFYKRKIFYQDCEYFLNWVILSLKLIFFYFPYSFKSRFDPLSNRRILQNEAPTLLARFYPQMQ
jgi:hypothetical protein